MGGPRAAAAAAAAAAAQVLASRLGPAAAARSMRSSAAAGGLVEVCFVDPRTILQRDNLRALLADDKLCTRLAVPHALLEQLSKGQMELGDMDDPSNSWYFGARDELFKYRLMGQHPTMSGFTSVLEQQQLAALCAEGGAEGLPAWEDFRAELVAGSLAFPSIRSPFLFAGSVLDAPAAAVYQLVQGGEVVGVAVSSEAA